MSGQTYLRTRGQPIKERFCSDDLTPTDKGVKNNEDKMITPFVSNYQNVFAHDFIDNEYVST